MLDAYDSDYVISKEEKARISRLERFDEFEEWRMLMSHYSMTIAAKGDLSYFSDYCNYK